MDIFDFDAKLALRQAKTMEQCAEELLFQRRQIDTIISSLRSAWEGEAASIYLRKLEAFGEALETNALNLRKGAVDFNVRIDQIVADLEAMEAAIGNAINNPTP